MINNWKNICINKDATLKEAMQNLNEFALRITLVVNDKYHLIGTVTDGDIRRGLLRGLVLEAKVSEVMNTQPLVTSIERSPELIQVILNHNSLLAIPIVNSENIVVGLETIESLDEKHNGANFDVVIMAGGFGKRLHPLTATIPKPMLQLGTKPILGHIIEDFISQGFKKFYISTHYKSEVIKDHFKNGQQLGVNIEYIEEDEPMGTAGVLYFLKDKLRSPFIIMNGDLLVKINFRSLIDFHKNHNALATMCIRQSSYKIPYGVVELEDMNIKTIAEKPLYSYFINAGIYCVNNKIFEFIYKKEYLDMPTLFQKIINSGNLVCAFPVCEYWVDIGCMEEYQKAEIDN